MSAGQNITPINLVKFMREGLVSDKLIINREGCTVSSQKYLSNIKYSYLHVKDVVLHRQKSFFFILIITLRKKNAH